MKALAIDPGPKYSAYCLIDDNYLPIKFGKVLNEEVMEMITTTDFDHMAIEVLACFGMAVGKEVFETAYFIGKLLYFCEKREVKSTRVFRKDVKINICNSMKAKDSNIRQALIDRFGVVGTKKNPGYFYGFSKDMWSAYAIGCTFLDLHREQ